MATKILQSFNPYAFALSALLKDGKELPAVELPKARYRPGEVYANGPRRGFPARSIMEVTDIEQERLEAGDPASAQIQQLFAKGTYRYLDHVPESMQTAEDMVAKLKAENEELRGKLGMPVNPGPAAKTEEPAKAAAFEEPLDVLDTPVVSMTAAKNLDEDARASLSGMIYADLQKMAKEHGVANVRVSRAKLIESILVSQGFSEAEVVDGEEESPGPSDPVEDA